MGVRAQIKIWRLVHGEGQEHRGTWKERLTEGAARHHFFPIHLGLDNTTDYHRGKSTCDLTYLMHSYDQGFWHRLKRCKDW